MASLGLWIDLSALVHRAYHGASPYAAGRIAVEWITNTIRRHRPSHAAVAVDLPFDTFRHELMRKAGVTAYKSGRSITALQRTQVLEQCRIAEELSEDVLGVRAVFSKGFEADDIIATLVAQAAWEGVPSLIVGRDKDLMQLLREGTDKRPHVYMVDGQGGSVILPGYVRTKFGVFPDRLVDYLALVGDKVDGYAGCPGIGHDGALKVLDHFATLSNAIDVIRGGWADSPGLWSGLSETLMKKLAKGLASAELSLILARLREDAPIRFKFEELIAFELPESLR